MSTIKQAIKDTALVLFIFIIMPAGCLLLLLAVGLTFGRCQRLNELTICTSLATLGLILVVPAIDNTERGITWLRE